MLWFHNKGRKECMAKYVDLDYRQIIKKAGEEWTNMPAEKKKKWLEMAKMNQDKAHEKRLFNERYILFFSFKM